MLCSCDTSRYVRYLVYWWSLSLQASQKGKAKAKKSREVRTSGCGVPAEREWVWCTG